MEYPTSHLKSLYTGLMDLKHVCILTCIPYYSIFVKTEQLLQN